MKNNFKFLLKKFKDLFIIKCKKNIDYRGAFSKLFDDENFQKLKLKKIYQINFSENIKKGTLRGMHYQIKPYEEDKIIKCISGSIFDVVIDLRAQSKTYLKTYSYILKNDNTLIYIPRGFAHGFQTLENKSNLLYIHGNKFSDKNQRGIAYNSDVFDIKWPLKKKILSERDKNFPHIYEM